MEKKKAKDRKEKKRVRRGKAMGKKESEGKEIENETPSCSSFQTHRGERGKGERIG